MILKDLYDVFNAIEKDRFMDRFGKNGMYFSTERKSMAKMADDAIFQFPVLASDSISQEELDMVNSSLEYSYANFVLTALSLDASIDTTRQDTNVRERLRRYHQNNTTDYKKLGITDTNRDVYFESAGLNCEDFNDTPINLNEAPPTVAGARNSTTRNSLHSPIVSANKPYKFEKTRNIEPLKFTTTFVVDGVENPVAMGIQCVPHRIPSEEVIYFAGTSTTDSRNLFRFIQWTSGEISFAKDFVMNFDGIMKRLELTKKKSDWWDCLRYRSILSDWKRFTFAKDQVLPNATLVLSMEEVEFINNEYHVNIFKDISAARNLMKKFFFLSIVILDSANETAFILYDSQNDYRYYSYNSLKKEPEAQDKALKAMLALAQR